MMSHTVLGAVLGAGSSPASALMSALHAPTLERTSLDTSQDGKPHVISDEEIATRISDLRAAFLTQLGHDPRACSDAAGGGPVLQRFLPPLDEAETLPRHVGDTPERVFPDTRPGHVRDSSGSRRRLSVSL